MYRLKTEQFLLELMPQVHWEDIQFPVNTSLGVRVSSWGFSAESLLDIDVRGLGNFSAQLMELYETLKGTARLEEPYGARSYIEFAAGARGHIQVKGCIYGGGAGGCRQKLAFENEVDQTELRGFAKALFTDYALHRNT